MIAYIKVDASKELPDEGIEVFVLQENANWINVCTIIRGKWYNENEAMELKPTH